MKIKDYSQLKNLDKSKKWKIAHRVHAGFIEDVYGTGVSFNVHKGDDRQKTNQFYKSAYTMQKAIEYLKELE